MPRPILPSPTLPSPILPSPILPSPIRRYPVARAGRPVAPGDVSMDGFAHLVYQYFILVRRGA